jgi:CheY-like chemotaxis protein
MSSSKESSKPIGISNNGFPIKVFVTDDEFPHRRLMVQLLKSVGFNVVAEATNGEEAIYYLGIHKPDLLLMDFHMPRKDGLETLKEIRATNKDLKVVMFTTETEKDQVTEVLKAGANGYIVKPIDRDLVLKKLDQLLHP